MNTFHRDAAQTLRVSTEGAELHVEVRGGGPAVVLFGCPMGADELRPLADELAQQFTVITADPRGFSRSHVHDAHRDVSPEELADDLAVVIEQVGDGTASVFGSSGGAVAALALLQRHPHRVRSVIAHEPPLEQLLDDRDALRNATEAMVSSYLAGDIEEAWRLFLASAQIESSPDELRGWLANRDDEQEIADEQFFFAHTLRPTTYWSPDMQRLRELSSRIVIGIGDESAGQVCNRTAAVLASEIGISRTTFPGDHTGFITHAEESARLVQSILIAPVTD